MKAVIAALAVLAMLGSVALAANQQGGYEMVAGVHIEEAGQEGATPELISAEETGKRAGTTEELRQMIQEREQEMDQEMETLGTAEKAVYSNQNAVRLAVHALLSMENLTGGIGRNVSQIAREFNNSVQATIRAEERIQARNALVRLFIGGDEAAAGEIEQEVNQNQQRILQLNQLREQCDCGEEVKALLQEQVQEMGQEQTRLKQLAQAEKQNKGLFGWLWK